MAPLTAKRRQQLGAELIEASFAGLHRDVGRLLEERADIEAVDRAGYTAISEAAMAGQTVVVGILLRALADPDRQAQDGRTALHRAAIHGWQPTIRLLLEHGADPFAKDAEGATPADMTKAVKIKELIGGFPAEQTAEARKERAKKLAELPPVEIAEEPEQEAAPEAAAEPTEVEAAQRAFQPPPRGGAAMTAAKQAAAAAKAEQEAKEKAERQARFDAKMNEIAREAGYEEAGESGFTLEKPDPPTQRCKVSGAGEDRLNGTYCARFVVNDRVEFEKVGDSQCQIFWSQHHDEWRMLIADFKLGSVLYRHKHRPNIKVEECCGVPKTGWQAWFGKGGSEPVVEHLPDRKPGEPEVEEAPAPAEAAEAAAGAPEAQPAAAGGSPKAESGGEYLELHSNTALRIVESGGTLVRDMASPTGKSAPEVSLHGGERIVETADGLFGAGEVQEVEDAGPEAAAAAWLEETGGQEEVPAMWEAVQAAKAASQQLFAAGKVADARKATSAAIRAAEKLEESAREGAHKEHSVDEVSGLLGILHSNRSLLVMNQITGNDAEVMKFGADAAWNLVVQDANIALRADQSNFKASFRRARGLMELGQLDDALADATRVVEHYELYSTTSNPEAGILRERILEAIKKERRKWGEMRPARWNKASSEVLIADVGETPAASSERRSPKAAVPPWEVDHSKAALASQQKAAAERLAAAPPKMPPAPRIGGEVEKALLSTLKGDTARQLAYIREHVSAATLRKFWRRAPFGPDLLGVLVRRLADLAEEDPALAAELLTAVGAAPSARTQADMFDKEERSALQRLLSKVGPEAAAKAWPEEEGSGSAGGD